MARGSFHSICCAASEHARSPAGTPAAQRLAELIVACPAKEGLSAIVCSRATCAYRAYILSWRRALGFCAPCCCRLASLLKYKKKIYGAVFCAARRPVLTVSPEDLILLIA